MKKPTLIPHFNQPGANFARFALRGCLTRLALCFDSRKKYTGAEVQTVLLSAMMSIDGPVKDEEVTEFTELERVKKLSAATSLDSTGNWPLEAGTCL